jgi:hypothetical protein
MEEPFSLISDRRTAAIAFLREALAESAVSAGELELKAREAGLLGERQRISHAKSFKRAKKVLGIKSVRTGFGRSGKWLWAFFELPQASAKATEVRLSRTGVGTEDIYAAARQGYARPEPRIPREWINGVARLDYHRAPLCIRLHRWRQFLDDCSSFLRSPQNGAARAAALGWDTYALFGCGPIHPLSHLGSAGLLWTLNGGRIVELHREWAVVEVAGSESRVTYNRLRADTSQARLPWELRSVA